MGLYRGLLSLLLLAPLAHSAVVLATSPAALGANSYIDWGQLGADLTTASSPFAVTSNLGLIGTVSGPNEFWAIQQGNTWGGNFAPGDNVLYSTGPGAFSISFASPVAGAGARFQSAFLGSFVARISAYDLADVILGTVSLAGTSNSAGDGSAIFVGARSTARDISRILINVQQSEADVDFAISRLELAVPPASVPEPSTVAFAVTGLLGIALLRRRR